jgi:hypothetical protein
VKSVQSASRPRGRIPTKVMAYAIVGARPAGDRPFRIHTVRESEMRNALYFVVKSIPFRRTLQVRNTLFDGLLELSGFPALPKEEVDLLS